VLDEFFYEYLSFNVILWSAGVFYFLKNANYGKVLRKFPKISLIFQNLSILVFGVYFIHPLVLTQLEKYSLTVDYARPIISIPLVTIACLGLSFPIVWLIYKIPVLNKIFV
jgi:surface polysaccharide O-acyltransferase-like enzyme